jgi:hypothetical protein
MEQGKGKLTCDELVKNQRPVEVEVVILLLLIKEVVVRCGKRCKKSKVSRD